MSYVPNKRIEKDYKESKRKEVTKVKMNRRKEANNRINKAEIF